MAKKLESKFWQEVKQNTPGISWTRLESWASAGVPDLLGYNKKLAHEIEDRVHKMRKSGL